MLFTPKLISDSFKAIEAFSEKTLQFIREELKVYY
jgi:hypothetical protein